MCMSDRWVTASLPWYSMLLNPILLDLFSGMAPLTEENSATSVHYISVAGPVKTTCAWLLSFSLLCEGKQLLKLECVTHQQMSQRSRERERDREIILLQCILYILLLWQYWHNVFHANKAAWIVNVLFYYTNCVSTLIPLDSCSFGWICLFMAYS